jgi:hypothetical protein
MNIFLTRRGNAMTELLICLFPYTIMLLGVVLLTEICMGKQEMLKSVAWTSPKPAEQTGDEVASRFFVRENGTGKLTETIPYTPDAEKTTEEPVLPYEGDDITAAITRSAVNISHTSRVEDGKLVVDVDVNATREGNEMIASGIVNIPDDLLSGITIDPDADVKMDFDVDEELAGNIAEILGDWVGYSASNAEFSYQLKQGLMAGETDDEGAQQFRQEFVLGGDIQPEFTFYCATPNNEGFHGYHCSDSVDMSDFSAKTVVADDSTTVDPVSQELCDTIIKDSDTNQQQIWDKGNDP